MVHDVVCGGNGASWMECDVVANGAEIFGTVEADVMIWLYRRSRRQEEGGVMW